MEQQLNEIITLLKDLPKALCQEMEDRTEKQNDLRSTELKEKLDFYIKRMQELSMIAGNLQD
jgi:hypothetical protein